MYNNKTKFEILFSMRKWPLRYIEWRLITAYPNGWKYVIFHPFLFIRDLWHFLDWCQKIDNVGEK